jgi:predicted dehydrogenase
MSTDIATNTEYARRDFLKGGSIATVMTLLGGVPLFAQEKPAEAKPAGPKIKCAIIGINTWGREILTTLQRVAQAEIAVVCDTYPAALKRAKNAIPDLKTTDDYKTILDDKEIAAVIIATPTHLHKEIAIAALKAGKHVYCEAPLAHTVEDAREIAKAARDNFKQVFQAGLQMRSDPQNWFLLPFIRSGACGKPTRASGQWNKKTTWRFASPNPDREKDLNWRLEKSVSTGLIGEIGIHQIDRLTWFLDSMPEAVTGYGAVNFHADGREISDSVNALYQFKQGPYLTYNATLGNSFEGEFEVFYGSDAAVLLRQSRAWMFKEVDAPLLGWEVYARKESHCLAEETGIVLRADASKQTIAVGNNPGQPPPNPFTPLYYALENFLGNCAEINNAVEDYASTYDVNNAKAFSDYLKTIKLRHAADYKDGYIATVLAIKGNEAVMKRGKIDLSKELFEIG